MIPRFTCKWENLNSFTESGDCIKPCLSQTPNVLARTNLIIRCISWRLVMCDRCSPYLKDYPSHNWTDSLTYPVIWRSLPGCSKLWRSREEWRQSRRRQSGTETCPVGMRRTGKVSACFYGERALHLHTAVTACRVPPGSWVDVCSGPLLIILPIIPVPELHHV